MEVKTSDGMNKRNEYQNPFLYVICVPIIILMVWGYYNVISLDIEARKDWEKLKEKSEVHRVLIGTYRDCRTALFGKTVEECMLLVKEYGELVGYTKELEIVMKDLKITSMKIKQRT